VEHMSPDKFDCYTVDNDDEHVPNPLMLEGSRSGSQTSSICVSYRIVLTAQESVRIPGGRVADAEL